jgi:hypothetical protein
VAWLLPQFHIWQRVSLKGLPVFLYKRDSMGKSSKEWKFRQQKQKKVRNDKRKYLQDKKAA